MAGTETITLRLVAQDLLSGNVTKAISGLDKLAKQGGLVGSVMQGVGQSFGQMLNPVGLLTRGVDMFTDALGDAVNAAREDQVSQVRLRAALEANIEAWDGNADAIEDVIAARTKLGFQDDEQRSVLASLVTVTEDLNDALAIERTAMDLARLKGIDLASAAKVLGNAYAGATGQLAKMGIRLGKGVSGMEALEAVQGRVAGQAEEYARTAAGASDRMNIAIGELSESIGYLLSGPAADLAGFIADLAGTFLPRSDSALKESTKWLKVYTDQVFHAATEQRGFNEAIADGPKPIDIFTDALDSWIIKQGDLLAQLDSTGELARMMSGVNRTLAFTTGLTADEIFQLAQVTQIAGGDLDELTINMQKLIGAGIDLQGMAMRYVTDVGSMEDATNGYLDLMTQWDELMRRPQVGAAWAGDLYDLLKVNLDVIKQNWGRVPEIIRTEAMNAGLVAEDYGGEVTRAFTQPMKRLGPVARSAIIDMKEAIKSGKSQVIEQMRDLAWQTKHPFAVVNYEDWLRDRAKAALRKMKEANKNGRADLVGQYATLYDDIIAEIRGLPGYAARIAARVIANLDPIVAAGFTWADPGSTYDPGPGEPRRRRKRPKGKKAGGGPVSAGGSYLVGEDGPELLTMGTSSGYVTPNHAMGAIHVHLHGFLAAPTEAQLSQVARTIGPAIRREAARAGG